MLVKYTCHVKRTWDVKSGDVMRFILSIFFLILTVAGALAAPITTTPLYTTAQLRALCDSAYDVDAGLCAGYIMAVADDLQQQGQACLSPQIQPETLVANLRRAWQQNLAAASTSALHNVQEIIQSRFPCR